MEKEIVAINFFDKHTLSIDAKHIEIIDQLTKAKEHLQSTYIFDDVLLMETRILNLIYASIFLINTNKNFESYLVTKIINLSIIEQEDNSIKVSFNLLPVAQNIKPIPFSNWFIVNTQGKSTSFSEHVYVKDYLFYHLKVYMESLPLLSLNLDI